MSDFLAPLSDEEPRSGDAYRSRVLAALLGAEKRGWLGPVGGVGQESAASVDVARVMALDALALSIKSALERVTLPLTRTALAGTSSATTAKVPATSTPLAVPGVSTAPRRTRASSSS